MLRVGLQLGVLAPSEADPGLIRSGGWLGRFEEALSASKLNENGGGRGVFKEREGRGEREKENKV